MIDVSNQIENLDWKTFFITNLKRSPFVNDISMLAEALGVPEKGVDILLKEKYLAVAISKSTLNRIQKKIDGKPNLFQKILKNG